MPPHPTWPEAGSANTITFTTPENCQQLIPGGDDRATAHFGRFYLYAYSTDVLCITSPALTEHTGFEVTDCSGLVTSLPWPQNAGKVGFGIPGGGYDPCEQAIPVEPTTWSHIKSWFR